MQGNYGLHSYIVPIYLQVVAIALLKFAAYTPVQKNVNCNNHLSIFVTRPPAPYISTQTSLRKPLKICYKEA